MYEKSEKHVKIMVLDDTADFLAKYYKYMEITTVRDRKMLMGENLKLFIK